MRRDRCSGDVIGRVRVLARLGEVARPDAVGPHLVGVHVDQVDELLVRDVAVVALQEVVDDVLPVGRHVVGQPFGVRQLRDVRCPARDVGGQVAGLLRQRFGVRVEVDVDHAAELLDLHLVEADLALVEGFHLVRAAGGLEVPVEAVGPGVVGADDVAGRARAGEELMGAVLAYVVERPQSTVSVAHDGDGHPGHGRCEVVARRPQCLAVADPLPRPGEDRLQTPPLPTVGACRPQTAGTSTAPARRGSRERFSVRRRP